MSKLDELTSWNSDWSELRVLVFGLGVSGFSAADTLHELGAKVLVIADKADEKLVEVLDVLGVESLIGAEEQNQLDSLNAFNPELVIISPGIRPENHLLVAATALGAAVWTDIDLAWRLRDKHGMPSNWICITGTNGKTTVTQLVEAMLLSAGIRAVACGNIGTPILDVVRDPAAFEVLVVELSSFQLHYLNEIAPVVSTVLNIADDHLDWHGSIESYKEAKAKIYNNTSICCVYNSGDSVTEKLVALSRGTENAQAVGFTVNTPMPNEIGWVEDILVDRAFIDDPAEAQELATFSDLKKIPVISPHLMANLAAASAIARAVGVQPLEIQNALQGFALDAHRIELVHEQDGIRWVDDSKATNPHAAAAALASFESVIWIVGGLLKGVDIAPLVEKYSARIKFAIIIGADRAPVVEAFKNKAPNIPFLEITESKDSVMSAVIEIAKANAVSGDVVLLAPAAASMDQFVDYADRGNAFAKAIEQGVRNTNG
jgi:UDP-N-acetylmuramoylalanine--D-glutamate ligase